jgi:hypothetical protein
VSDRRVLSEISQSERNNAVFREEYSYYRRMGHAHVVAERRALDYYRKFLRREITENWERLVDEQYQDDQAQEVIEGIQFNQIVARMLKELTARQRELFCYVVVQQDLDRYLDAANLRLVERVTGGRRPVEVREIARLMGLNLSRIGVCTPITKMRQRIREAMTRSGFTLESLTPGRRGG